MAGSSRWRGTRRVLVVLAIAVTGACAHGSKLTQGSSPLQNLTREERLAAIARAQVWAPTHVRAMNLRAGPRGPGALAPFAAVRCKYVEEEMGGTSPKFACELPSGDKVKVKYGADNGEVPAVIAATRLLWALGFGADRWYPVSVTCHGCPADPHHDARRTQADVSFPIAAIERKMAGQTMETQPDEGWKWSGLELVDEKKGGAPRAHRDALKLLAAMLQHTDSKAQQQRLVCLPGKSGAKGGHGCAAPFMLIHDLGLTFGKANFLNRASEASVNFADWSKTPVWEDAGRCVSRLSRSFTGTLHDPVISEAGRKFLADLLVQLSDAQLRDLFEVARFPQYSHASVEEWIAAFKKKRDEIVSVTCPS